MSAAPSFAPPHPAPSTASNGTTSGVGPLTLTRPTDGGRVRLSVLDLAGVGDGVTVSEALAATTELAVTTERLGYHRFWVAEHHGMPAVASAAPPVLLAHLAAHTTSIRLGSGGVMLPNHAPLAVAEQFGTLAALHPGRIDLGLGRAPGSDQLTAHALRRRMAGTDGDDFAAQVAELRHFLQDSFPPSHPYARILTTPRADVPLYILGSSDYGARLAAKLGLPYAFAYHFAGANGGAELALELYRSQFRPSATLAEPYSMIGVTALAAETDEQAQYEARAGALSMLLLRSGRLQAIPTPEQAAEYPYRPEELQLLAAMSGTEIVGTADTVADELADVAGRLGADELLITSRVHGAATRRRSFELLAAQVRAGS
ncbi:LLM class flavin-dependent oxidoreductase [Nakamurella flava]|uniref:LLM class flavin-dependent oxidoreductase n=1 Tax=Nakamurella flava TaxID=2576308 RepID=UPI001F0F37F4|nr:LLM class flavin-dependent oxidoreductase [Nakamurella flava]